MHQHLCWDFIIWKDKAPKIRSSACVVLPLVPEDPHRRARMTLQRGNNPSGIVHPCHTHIDINMSIGHTLDLKGEGVAISLGQQRNYDPSANAPCFIVPTKGYIIAPCCFLPLINKKKICNSATMIKH